METKIGMTYTDIHANGHLNGNGYRKGTWNNIFGGNFNPCKIVKKKKKKKKKAIKPKLKLA